MIKKIFLLSLCCLATVILVGQQKPLLQKEGIVFNGLTHDYGTIEVGSPGHCEFRFTNTMKKALVISDVKPSCGCTVASWPKEPVPAGKTGVIKINYNTKIPGTFYKTIAVNSNAGNATVILRIKGNVIRFQNNNLNR
jgi:hypothetical protein